MLWAPSQIWQGKHPPGRGEEEIQDRLPEEEGGGGIKGDAFDMHCEQQATIPGNSRSC